MPESTLFSLLMQATDGHPASAASAARRPAEVDRYNTAERVVLAALLRHAREKSLKTRVLGDHTATGSNYPMTAGERAGN